MMRLFWAPLLAVALVSPLVAQSEPTTVQRSNAPGTTVQLPELIARSWAGDAVDLHNVAGHPVLLVFWERPTSGC